MASPRFHTIDFLRGFAALAVAWFHFTNGSPVAAIGASGRYGYLGIAIFFVISGFIIPHALSLARYRLSDYGTFLLKRIIRLDPAYLVSIAAILVLGSLDRFAPGFHGPSLFHPTVPQVLVHLGYVNCFFDYPWLSPVYWTLAIEFQYYLFLGLIFPALNSPRFHYRAATLLLLAGSGFVITAPKFFFYHSLLFLMGFMVFYLRSGLLGRTAFLGILILLAAAAAFRMSLPIAFAGAATACMIAFVDLEWAGPPFFGRVSYSLYLCHVPVGARLLRASEKLLPGVPGHLTGLGLAMGGSLAAAWLLHRLVEQPSQRWSSAIGYRSRQIAPTGFGPRVG